MLFDLFDRLLSRAHIQRNRALYNTIFFLMSPLLIVERFFYISLSVLYMYKKVALKTPKLHARVVGSNQLNSLLLLLLLFIIIFLSLISSRFCLIYFIVQPHWPSLPRRRFQGSSFFIPQKEAPLKTPVWEATLIHMGNGAYQIISYLLLLLILLLLLLLPLSLLLLLSSSLLKIDQLRF